MGRICMHIRQTFVDSIQNEISKNTVMRCDSSHISTLLYDVNYELADGVRPLFNYITTRDELLRPIQKNQIKSNRT